MDDYPKIRYHESRKQEQTLEEWKRSGKQPYRVPFPWWLRSQGLPPRLAMEWLWLQRLQVYRTSRVE
jgi:hypothetical protein